jgi:hypothetical protein
MSRPSSKALRRTIVAGGVLAGLAIPSAASAADSSAVVLTTDNKISTFETAYPTEATAPRAITDRTGAAIPGKFVAIDVRPQNGAVYALNYRFDPNAPATSTIQLFALSVRTGVATPIGGTQTVAGTSAYTANTQFGFDFNPTVDRIRVVSDSGMNGRLNPNTGGYTADTSIADTTKVDGAAYTNNQQNATATSLFTLAGDGDKLYLQTLPNDGTQTAPKDVKVNGQTVDFSSVGGFDISPGVNVATSNTAPPAGSGGFIATNAGGKAALSVVDLNTGAAATVGAIGDGNTPVQGLAIQQEAVTGGVPSVAISGTSSADLKLLRFNTADPVGGKEVPITGVDPADVPAAIDWRPQTGQLVLLTINSVTNAAQLYNVDPQNPTAPTPGNATATPIGAGATYADAAGVPVPLPSPTLRGYDIDFNPTVDAVRVVTSSGLNFRINANTGAAVDGNLGGVADSVANTNTDGDQNGAATDVSGTAYTNAFGQELPASGAAAIGKTTQYGISSAKDQLLIQNPPNAGTQTAPLGITVGGSKFDFSGVKGFDIPAGVSVANNAEAATGSGIAVLSTAATAGGLYSIDLKTGAATLRGVLPGTPTSLAIGDGPAPAKNRSTPPTTPGTNPPVILPPTTPTTPVKPPVIVPPATLATFGKSTKLTVKLRSTRSKRNGPAKVTFRNTNNFSVKVRLQATTPKSGKRKAIKYSTKTYTVKKSSSRTINLRLPSAARKVLQSKKKLTIKVTLRVTDPAKKNRTVRKTLTLRLSR